MRKQISLDAKGAEPARKDETNSDHGLFVTDAELLRRLGLPEKIGRRMLREVEKHLPGRQRFPQQDPLFGRRRFYPAVLQWLYDYYGVTFDPLDFIEARHAPLSPDKAKGDRRARSDLASTS
jgi:hypothetical protein